jgi:hypothetical protein
VAIVVAIAVAAIDPSATAIVTAARLPEPSATLVVRFIDRSRRFRRTGAIAALLAFLAGLVVWTTERDTSGFNIDLVTMVGVGLAGSTLGSIAAEAFRLRTPRGPRVASLDVRDPEAYRDHLADRLEWVILALTTIVIVGGAVTGARVVIALWWGAGLVTLAGLRRWATRAVAVRPRPVVPASVQEARS